MLTKVQTFQALWTNPGLGVSAAKDNSHLETNAITGNSSACQISQRYSDHPRAAYYQRASQIWLCVETLRSFYPSSRLGHTLNKPQLSGWDPALCFNKFCRAVALNINVFTNHLWILLKYPRVCMSNKHPDYADDCIFEEQGDAMSFFPLCGIFLC